MQPAARLRAASFFSRYSAHYVPTQVTSSNSAMCLNTPHMRGAQRRSSSGGQQQVFQQSSLESLCSSSMASTPSTPFSARSDGFGDTKDDSIRMQQNLSPVTPDGFYGFGDENDLEEPGIACSDSTTGTQKSRKSDGVVTLKAFEAKSDCSMTFIMASPSQSSLVRRRQKRSARPKSCPTVAPDEQSDSKVETPTFHIGDISAGSIFRRRKAASLGGRPKTADFVSDDCAFGFNQEFTVTASRWRGVIMDKP